MITEEIITCLNKEIEKTEKLNKEAKTSLQQNHVSQRITILENLVKNVENILKS